LLERESSQNMFLSNEYYIPFPLIPFSIYTSHIPNNPNSTDQRNILFNILFQIVTFAAVDATADLGRGQLLDHEPWCFLTDLGQSLPRCRVIPIFIVSRASAVSIPELGNGGWLSQFRCLNSYK